MTHFKCRKISKVDISSAHHCIVLAVARMTSSYSYYGRNSDNRDSDTASQADNRVSNIYMNADPVRVLPRRDTIDRLNDETNGPDDEEGPPPYSTLKRTVSRAATNVSYHVT